MDEPDFLELMRERAKDLAATARYAGWPRIAGALAQDGRFHPLLIARIGADPEFVALINARCALAARMRNA